MRNSQGILVSRATTNRVARYDNGNELSALRKVKVQIFCCAKNFHPIHKHMISRFIFIFGSEK